MSLVEVTIDSVRVSMVNGTNIVILKEIDSERYLPVLIGAEISEAIQLHLKKAPIMRPMTHDLLNNIVTTLGGKVSHIVVVDLHDNIFYAQITVDRDGQVLEIDSRTSDALALAVRTNAKIFVEEHVMEEAAIHPEKGLTLQSQEDSLSNAEEDENLEAFEDFIDTLDLDDLQ